MGHIEKDICSGIGTISKSTRILKISSKKVLEDEISVPYIAFIAFVANDFEIFLKTFQSMKSRIRILYPEMGKLLISLMSKFVKSKLLRDDSNNTKSVTELLTINVKDAKNCKPLNLIDIGTKVKSSFPESLDVTSEEKKFRHNCLEAYQAFFFKFETEIAMGITNFGKCRFPRPCKESG